MAGERCPDTGVALPNCGCRACNFNQWKEHGMRSKLVAVVKPRDPEAEAVAAEAPHPRAKAVLPHGLQLRSAIVCNACASLYDPGLVSDVSYREVSDALHRISEDLIGRVGPAGEGKSEACFDCEKEL